MAQAAKGRKKAAVPGVHGRLSSKAANKSRNSGQNSAGNMAMMLTVLQQFRVVVRSVRAHYDHVEKSSGVSGAQLWALASVQEHPGVKVGELARALAIHQSTASNMLERLVGLGLVVKRRVGEDQRVVSVYTTARGRAALKSAPQPLIGVLQQALSDLPPSVLQGLHQNLKTVIQAMGVKDLARARSTPLSEM